MKYNILRIALICFSAIIPLACSQKDSTKYPEGSDFTLTDHNAQPFTFYKNLKKVNLLFFGYTLCPDICPVSMNKIKKAVSGLGEKEKDVRVFFISVDPGRDKPEKLKTYLSFFELDSVGLTGTKEQIDYVVRSFQATYQINQSDSKAGYLIDHTSIIYLVDDKGKVRYMFRHKDTAENMTSVIKLMIN